MERLATSALPSTNAVRVPPSLTPLLVLLAVFLPLVAAPIVAIAGGRWGARTGSLALWVPAVSFIALVLVALQVGPQPNTVFRWPWVPGIGLELAFLVDGLSVFFALIVTGMGMLITFYARQYLDDHFRDHGRFYAYLLIFMSAMLGTVLANNLLLLFVFWELTGLASFLLIGFSHATEESRRGARMALLVTGATGLCLLVGVVLIRQITGTYDLQTLLREPLGDDGSGLVTVAMVLMLVGAFGKSAQFPFQFWLPKAMAAPTPVSAYLHSATMVKLGVFLTARLFPIFSTDEVWAPLLTGVAFFTMTLGALLALAVYDLKALLAFSTVSQLGYLIGYYGLAQRGAVEYDYLHILSHVFYKGGLFMVVGIIDHATGTRDLRQLGGLWRRDPWLGVVTAVLCATMAGLPFTTGFISKEVMLKEIFAAPDAHGGLGMYALICVLITSVAKVMFSARIFFQAFGGRESPAVTDHFHRPTRALLVGPLMSAGGALLFGVAPGLLVAPIRYLDVAGIHLPSAVPLALWHGFNRELAISLGIVAVGAGAFFVINRQGWDWLRVPRALQFDVGFEAMLDGISKFAKGITRAVGSDSPLMYLKIILGFIVVLIIGSVWYVYGPAAILQLANSLTEVPIGQTWDPLRTLVAGLIALTAFGAVVLRGWTTRLISLSLAGFLTTFLYVLYQAPDLALTQVLVETISLVLVLLLLGRFPKTAEEGEREDRGWAPRKIFAFVTAVALGASMTVLMLVVTARPHPEPVGPFYLVMSRPLAKGDNAVNTILVDFRGFDTLGEITVLFVATLGCLGLFMRYKRSAAEWQHAEKGPAGFGVHHSEDRP